MSSHTLEEKDAIYEHVNVFLPERLFKNSKQTLIKTYAKEAKEKKRTFITNLHHLQL